MAGVAAIGALTACGSLADANSTLPPLAPSSSTGTDAPTVMVSTTVAAPDARLVDDCVSYVQFGAFTGNSLLTAMWNEAGQDASVLRANCETLGATNLVGLQNMSAQWRDIETYIAASQAPATSPP